MPTGTAARAGNPSANSPTIPTVVGANNVRYRAEFHGNGNVIDNLFINRTGSSDDPGFFGAIGTGGKVTALGFRNANVTGGDTIGIVTPINYGTIAAVYTTGSITGADDIGGLTGYNAHTGKIIASYSSASVRRGTGATNSTKRAGGLVGVNHSGNITASYATGRVSGITNTATGGLVGYQLNGVVTDSYWDETTTGQATSAGATAPFSTPSGGAKQTTANLQAPTAYNVPATGNIYAAWNVDLDGDGSNDDPWDFGSSSQYPALKYGGHRLADQRGGRYRHCHHQQRRGRYRVPRRGHHQRGGVIRPGRHRAHRRRPDP